ncbi:MAG: RNA polymerase sigma factor [Myxococcales bacterium]
MAPDADEQLARGFPATRHSALAAIRTGDAEKRRRALSSVAAAYWRPVYGYLRLHWRKPHEEASDLTQDFFAHALEKDLLARFDPARARLRTFLRACIDRVAAEDGRAARRLKRGGGAEPVGFDFEVARAAIENAASTAEAPDVLFEREWARGMFAAGLLRLRELCAREGKSQHFALLEQYDLGAGPERPSYADLARQHGIAATDVTNRLAWARRKLREVLLELLRESTGSESELREEARALLGLDGP